jgi:hypothetical protein
MAASIDFGWGRKPLNVQLDDLGFDFNSAPIMHLEADMAAALRLHLRHQITESAWRHCVRKITKAIEKEIRLPAESGVSERSEASAREAPADQNPHPPILAREEPK